MRYTNTLMYIHDLCRGVKQEGKKKGGITASNTLGAARVIA